MGFIVISSFQVIDKVDLWVIVKVMKIDILGNMIWEWEGE